MRLKDVPTPLWYLAGAGLAAVALYWLAKRAGAALGAAADAVGSAAFDLSGKNFSTLDQAAAAYAKDFNTSGDYHSGYVLDPATGRYVQPPNYNANARPGVPVPK